MHMTPQMATPPSAIHLCPAPVGRYPLLSVLGCPDLYVSTEIQVIVWPPLNFFLFWRIAKHTQRGMRPPQSLMRHDQNACYQICNEHENTISIAPVDNPTVGKHLCTHKFWRKKKAVKPLRLMTTGSSTKQDAL